MNISDRMEDSLAKAKDIGYAMTKGGKIAMVLRKKRGNVVISGQTFAYFLNVGASLTAYGVSVQAAFDEEIGNAQNNVQKAEEDIGLMSE